jgi:hypothetical protein
MALISPLSCREGKVEILKFQGGTDGVDAIAQNRSMADDSNFVSARNKF